MAISVHEAMALNEGVYHIATVTIIEEHIDQRLKDPQYRKDWICGSNTDAPFFRFAVPGHVTAGDKKEVKRRYEEQGWINVVVTNSSENGERAGMIGIKVGVPQKAKANKKVDELIRNFINVHQRTGVLGDNIAPWSTNEMIRCTLDLNGELTTEDCQLVSRLFLAAGWNFVDFNYTFSETHQQGVFDGMEVIKSSVTPK